MNKEQTDLAVEHYHLIKDFLRLKGYPFDEFFDVIAFGFMRAIVRYTQQEDLRQRYTFKTIAFRCMRDDICRYHRRENALKRAANVCHYEEDAHASYLDDGVWDGFAKRQIAGTVSKQLFGLLTPRQRTVARMKGDGHFHIDIAARLGVSASTIDREMRAITAIVKNQAAELYELIAA